MRTHLASAFALAGCALAFSCQPILTLGASGKPTGGLELDEARVRCDAKEACACGSLGRWHDEAGDKPAAEKAYARGCELGCAEACADLCDKLLDGGRETDRAVKLGLRACQANGALCERMAKRYEEGRGVPQDAEKAKLVRAEACKQGVASACGK